MFVKYSVCWMCEKYKVFEPKKWICGIFQVKAKLGETDYEKDIMEEGSEGKRKKGKYWRKEEVKYKVN